MHKSIPKQVKSDPTPMEIVNDSCSFPMVAKPTNLNSNSLNNIDATKSTNEAPSQEEKQNEEESDQDSPPKGDPIQTYEEFLLELQNTIDESFKSAVSPKSSLTLDPKAREILQNAVIDYSDLVFKKANLRAREYGRRSTVQVPDMRFAVGKIDDDIEILKQGYEEGFIDCHKTHVRVRLILFIAIVAVLICLFGLK